jgi:O-antigen/teichoic acid export membrane protein
MRINPFHIMGYTSVSQLAGVTFVAIGTLGMGPDERGLQQRLAKGFGSQGLQLAARLTQQIVLVPLLIAAWSERVYQDWIVLFAAANLVPMLELGTQAYFGNLLLDCWARGNRSGFRRTLHLSFGVQAIIVLAACTFAAAASLVLDWPNVFRIQVLPHREAVLAILLLAIGNLATVPQGLMTTIYRARGDFSRYVNITTLMIGLETSGMAAVVLLGGSPVATAAVYTTAIALTWILLVIDQHKRYPDLHHGLRLPSRAELGEIAGTAPFHFVNSATTIVVANGPILILQAVSPGAAIVAFSASRVVVGILRQLVHQMAHACGVEMARQRAQAELVALRLLFLQTGRMAGALFGLLGGALLVVGGPFFQIWMRGNVAFEPWLFAALLLNVFLVLPGQAPLTMLFYSNQPRPISLAYAGHTIGGLILVALLAPRFGATGAAVGMGVAECAMIGLWLARRGACLVGISFLPYLLTTLGIAILCFAVSFGVARVASLITVPHRFADLLIFGAIWLAMMTGPAFLLMKRWQRTWILRQIRGSA